RMISLPRSGLLPMLLCLFVAVSGCSGTVAAIVNPTAVALMQSPADEPDFLGGLKPPPGSKQYSVSKICANIGYAPLWEAGDTEESTVNSILSRVILDVDGTIIYPGDSPSYMYSGPATIVQDNAGNRLGEIGTFDICYPVKLGAGIHVATSQFFTTSRV